MKKLILMSGLLGVASATILSVAPISAQSVPIIGGSLGLNLSSGINSDNVNIVSFTVNATTVLTPLGAVNISVFNGSISSSTNNVGPGSYTVAGSAITFVSGFSKFVTGNGFLPATTFVFTGTTNGTAMNTSFTNAPTTINATTPLLPVNSGGNVNPPPAQIQTPITGGSITLPVPPVSGDFLSIGSNLQIANSTLPSSDKSNPEYRQEYNNGFSSPSSSRILPLDIK